MIKYTVEETLALMRARDPQSDEALLLHLTSGTWGSL
jgi:hypothetical protein